MGTCTIKADHVKRESSLLHLQEVWGKGQVRSGAEQRTLLLKGTSERCLLSTGPHEFPVDPRLLLIY